MLVRSVCGATLAQVLDHYKESLDPAVNSSGRVISGNSSGRVTGVSRGE
jgi:hypothetical protein